MTDSNFAARLISARKSQGLTQQQLVERSGAQVTQIRRYEAGTSRPPPSTSSAHWHSRSMSALTRSSSTTTNAAPTAPTLRLKLEAVDQFTPEEQEHVAAFIEGALLRHHARQAKRVRP